MINIEIKNEIKNPNRIVLKPKPKNRKKKTPFYDKPRFSIFQVVKTLGILGIISVILLGANLIWKQKQVIEDLRGWNTNVEGRYDDCQSKWRELEEKGEVIYSIKRKED